MEEGRKDVWMHVSQILVMETMERNGRGGKMLVRARGHQTSQHLRMGTITGGKERGIKFNEGKLG